MVGGRALLQPSTHIHSALSICGRRRCLLRTPLARCSLLAAKTQNQAERKSAEERKNKETVSEETKRIRVLKRVGDFSFLRRCCSCCVRRERT